MANIVDIVETALAEVERARNRVARSKGKQIRHADTIDYLKSVAYSWFRSHRPVLQSQLPATTVNAVDAELNRLLDATGKASARATYAQALKNAKAAIMSLRAAVLMAATPAPLANEAPPDFAPVAADPLMRSILARRWDECQRCLQAEAHLAATVMMGGFLEALFVARANQLVDKSPLFRAKATPVDRSGKPRSLSEWTLRSYIEVAVEIGWISRSGKDVAEVLRDYRNYVHPEKERSHGVTLNSHDSGMFWEVTKSLTKQLLT